MRFLNLLMVLVLGGCGVDADVSQTTVRNLTPSEALADFDQLVAAVKTYYGPLEYKQRTLGITIDAMDAATRAELAAARSDADVYAAFVRFLARFEDGHVGIRFPVTAAPVASYDIGIFLQTIEGHAVVAEVDASLADTGIAVGDVVSTVDGKATMDYLPLIQCYDALGQDQTESQFIFRVFHRPQYMAELRPSRDMAVIGLTRPDGSAYTVEIPWTVSQSKPSRPFAEDVAAAFTVPAAAEFNAAAGASVMQWGAPVPFFYTDVVRQDYGFAEVVASPSSLAKFGAGPTDWPIFAALYRWQGKTILLVREPSYSGKTEEGLANFIKAYKAILSQYESLADVLVIDQTHNTGGAFCQEFYRLFIDRPANAFVQYNNTDRAWVRDLREMWPGMLGKMISDSGPAFHAAMEQMAAATERSYDAGLSITKDALPLIGGFVTTRPYADYHWKKPFLVLIDELAGSCGDIFPMLVKANKTAPLFGARTAGLGGNVDEVTVLGNSLASVRLTRGLYTTYKADGQYTDADMMENNGVTPDLPWEHTLADFRAGFVGYVAAFSDAAVKLVP